MATFLPRSRAARLRRTGSSKRPTFKSARRWFGATVKPTAPRRSSNREAPTPQTVRVSRRRLVLVWAVLLVGGLALTANLFRLQVIEAATLQQRAAQQQRTLIQPFAPRRPIIDRLGNVLAIDRPAFTLYAHPMLFKQPKAVIANQLSLVLDRSPEALIKQFDLGESGIEIAYALDEEVAKDIRSLGLDGLELNEHPQRLYPQQDLFAAVVGYVDTEQRGQAGLEYGKESLLEQRRQPIEVNRAGDGSLMPDRIPNRFLHQDDLRLQLTLDGRLQRIARQALAQKLEEYEAKRGAVLVMDVRDGALLTMVTSPTYDPNQYYDYDLERFPNWTLSDPYEPGSTFKPLNVAIALEAKAIQPDDVFHDPGQIEVGGWTVQNNNYEEEGGRGSLDVTQIVQYSSNVGMVRVMQQLPSEVYYSWLEQLGLGKPVGIDLPFEAAGQLKDREQFIGAAIEPATTAFGQGFTLTPIQLLQLHGMLANGGRLVTPHVVRGLFSSDGQMDWQPNFAPPKAIVSPPVAQTVLEMMEAVVQDGTGKAAQIPGYRIAGKTGTAQKPSSSGGYSDARITSFVSTFPVEAPRYTVLVVVDEPKGRDAFGSTVAAPVAKAMMEALISIDHLMPSQPLPAEPEAAMP